MKTRTFQLNQLKVVIVTVDDLLPLAARSGLNPDDYTMYDFNSAAQLLINKTDLLIFRHKGVDRLLSNRYDFN